MVGSRRKTVRGFCLAAAFLALPLLAAPEMGAAGGAGQPEIEILGEAPGQGEQCLVCRQPIHGATVVTVRYKGRVFHVKAAMLDELEADPESHFRVLQAHSALFDEDAMEGTIGAAAGGRGWLYFGLYVLAGLLFGAVSGGVAVARGHRPLRWFFAGLVVNVVALGALLARPRGAEGGPEGLPAGLAKVALTRSPRRCPHCGAPNHPAARTCSGCSGRLRAAAEAETGCLEGGEG